MTQLKHKIICGDCIDIMKEIESDLILTDPPYGIGETNEKNKSREKLAKAKDYGHYTWDLKKVRKEYFDTMLRISKNQIIFGGNYYANWLPPSSCWIVWDKDNFGSDFADCELVWTSFKSAVRKIKYRWIGMLQGNMKQKEQRFHPTQKPLPVLIWILKRYSLPTDLILDPFMGYGTTLIAAERLGRSSIGIDISKKYCEMSYERLLAEVSQIKMDREPSSGVLRDIKK